MLIDEEKPFRLRPERPRRTKGRGEVAAWSVLYKAVMRHARMSRSRRTGSKRHVATTTPHFQRCAIRVTYARNTVKGQWAAHGRYLARETAASKQAADPTTDAKRDSAELAGRLDTWQRAGDEQIWKLIISPEFGQRLDLTKLASELMQRIEDRRGGAALEWAAVAHYNTEHPHAHVVLRGLDQGGQAVRFSREFIKHGIRELVENLCTQQLGYRSEFDVEAGRRREVDQLRFTSLDRIIKGRTAATGSDGSEFFRISFEDLREPGRGASRLRDHHIIDRLLALQRMGLAESDRPNEWRVRIDFENVLRGMQRVADRQRVLAAHGVPLSDERLPIEATEGRDWKILEGRVLVHGEEEDGRCYLMLEGIDARVHHVYYTPQIEEARNAGKLRTKAFIRLRRHFVRGRASILADDMGDAESLVRNKAYMRATARQLVQRGVVPQNNGWGGWLGRYQAALQRAARELDKARTPGIPVRKKGNLRGR
jgi:type IV secretory pathway VirD2 relaxase